MQKNVPKYTPDWVRTVTDVGGGVQARGVLRAVQRPPHAALVRQPAGRRVPPDAGPGRPTRTHPTHLVLDLDPPDGRRVRAGGPRGATWSARRWPTSGLAGAVKTSGAKGVHVFVPLDGRTRRRGRRPRPPARSRRGPSGSTRRLPPRRSSGTTASGKVFLDSTRAGGATVVAAYSPRRPARRAGVVPGGLGRAGRGHAGRLHRPHRAGLLGDARSVGRRDARAAAAERRPVEEGHAIPVARVQAMHEGKRRARARRG